jgi:hypothetical protein
MRICKDEVPQTLPCVKFSLSRLSKKRSELSRNKQIVYFKVPFSPKETHQSENGALESVDQDLYLNQVLVLEMSIRDKKAASIGMNK